MSYLNQSSWENTEQIGPKLYKCGYCGKNVASNIGYSYKNFEDRFIDYYADIYICPNCGQPTFSDNGILTPGSSYGSEIPNLPVTVESIYNEARSSYKTGAYTAVILICRKVLMNVAIDRGAKPNLKYIEYVDYLLDEGYVPPKSKQWIDDIRKEGNSATHDETSKNKTDAKKILDFIQMLLLINYKFNDDLEKDSE